MRLPALVVCLSLTSASLLRAQAGADSTTEPFHPGEWGVQAIVASGVSEAGALRFSTPTRAWVLDGSASIERQSARGIQFSRSTIGSGGISVGQRWYHAPAHVVHFAGIGLTGGYTRYHYDVNATRGDIWTAGAYGEAGATYMFTPHVGVGGRALLTFSRTEDSTSQPTTTGSLTERDVRYRLAFAPVQVLATIYF